ncbi:ribosome small subunit-dependent GTPase A [Anoxybacter fermentans]|uniref:Small ribosomal subunit biogenesis GTPase RsgA n=1 Tax=Anoxybacter fermentans TaxID=1323375 RepID=A0A3Q9HPX1_9FIRM|nr:ribosome small subunit-dependent GTPase A [Anoxybacter fermentans]AZR72957.1 ribosome small subunit-dependent GTPase A [Anoxybacter fermentans]
MKTGIVIKAYSGFYYVKDDEQGGIYECRLRGRFKKKKKRAIPGDRVGFQDLGSGLGVIEEIFERKTLLTRPTVANVEQVIITFAAKDPDLHYKLLDQFLIMAEAAKLQIVICLNKIDLVDEEVARKMLKLYEEIGYKTLYCSAKTKVGIEDLRETLKDKISVFAGASGVGKSALLNAVQPGLKLATGEISEKIRRGTHTTRHVELLQLKDGGMVADTPGFSFFDLEFLSSEELPYLFPEMVDYIGQCRFQDCIHDHEPGCVIKEMVENGKIAKSRYENYVTFLHEIQEKEKQERGY